MSTLLALTTSACLGLTGLSSQQACNKGVSAYAEQAGIEHNLTKYETDLTNNAYNSIKETLGPTNTNILTIMVIVGKPLIDHSITISFKFQ